MDQTIFLSASVPVRAEWTGYQAREKGAQIRNAVMSCTRRILHDGGNLVFGGHPSVSPFILSVAEDYLTVVSDQTGRGTRISIYQSEAFPLTVRPAETLKLVRLGARLVNCQASGNEKYDPKLKTEQCLVSLAEMRKRMLTDTKPVAMIVIGGMEGVLRECVAYRKLFEDGLIFVLESTGGMAKRLVQPELVDYYKMVNLPSMGLQVISAEREFLPHWRDNEAVEVPYVLLAERIMGSVAQAGARKLPRAAG